MFVIVWGVVMICYGVVSNYVGIMVFCFMLGVFEVGFFFVVVFLSKCNILCF